MSLDPQRAGLWEALGLGPRWVERDSPEALAAAQAPGEQAVEAPLAPPPVASPQPAPRTAPRVQMPSRSEPRQPAPKPTSKPAAEAPPVADPQRAARIRVLDWQALRQDVEGCEACGLCESRTQTVFAAGAPGARWVVVGEAPGSEEDLRGEPFVGQAGKLLDAMLGSISLSRGSDVSIINVLKCRPPGNRNPTPEEVAACAPYLTRQLELLAPDIVLVLGRFAAQSLLGTETSIAGLRGRPHSIDIAGRAVPVVVSYHPAYLLRNLADKAKSWEDLVFAKRIAAKQ